MTTSISRGTISMLNIEVQDVCPGGSPWNGVWIDVHESQRQTRLRGLVGQR